MELHTLYSSPITISLMKMRWTAHVACVGDMITIYKIWLRELKGKDHLKDVCVHVRIILRWILK